MKKIFIISLVLLLTLPARLTFGLNKAENKSTDTIQKLRNAIELARSGSDVSDEADAAVRDIHGGNFPLMDLMLRSAISKNIRVGEDVCSMWYYGFGFKRDKFLALKAFKFLGDEDWVAFIYGVNPEIHDGREEEIDFLKKRIAELESSNPDSATAHKAYLTAILYPSGEECNPDGAPCGCEGGLDGPSETEMRNCMQNADANKELKEWCKFVSNFQCEKPENLDAFLVYRKAYLDFYIQDSYFRNGYGELAEENVEGEVADVTANYSGLFLAAKNYKFDPNISATDYANADTQLNRNYQVAMTWKPDEDKGESQGKNLKESERAWLKYRDASVEFYGKLHSDEFNSAIIELDLKTKMTIERAKFLSKKPADPFEQEETSRPQHSVEEPGGGITGTSADLDDLVKSVSNLKRRTNENK